MTQTRRGSKPKQEHQLKTKHGLTFGDSSGKKVNIGQLRPAQRDMHEIKTAVLRALESSSSSLVALQKTSDNILEFVTPPPSDPEPVSIFAIRPSGLRAKIKELRNRVKVRLNTYLNGRYSLHRGYTLLIVILYGMMLAIFVMFRISISG